MYGTRVRTNATNKFDFDSIVCKLASVTQSDCDLYFIDENPVRTALSITMFACAGSYLANDRFSIQVYRQRIASVLLELDFCFTSRIFIL